MVSFSVDSACLAVAACCEGRCPPWVAFLFWSYSVLTQDQIDFYNENGYLAVENVLTVNELDALR